VGHLTRLRKAYAERTSYVESSGVPSAVPLAAGGLVGEVGGGVVRAYARLVSVPRCCKHGAPDCCEPLSNCCSVCFYISQLRTAENGVPF